MKNLVILICGILMELQSPSSTAQIIELKPAPSVLAIDGNLNEWEEQFTHTDKKNTYSYLISNDHQNLYLVIKTKDTVCQANILGSGITFAVNTKNTKGIQKVTFPIKGKEEPSEYLYLDREQREMKAILARYKRIGIENFKNIKAEQLSTTNPYGIKVALGYTADGFMVYEEAIPLTLLFQDGIEEKCSFSIKVNGLARKFFLLTHIEMVPSKRGKDSREDQIDQYLLQKFPGNFRLNGSTPENDYEDKLTADTEVKGEFILTK